MGTTDRAAVPIGKDQPEAASKQTSENATVERTNFRMTNLL
jgi:hypothetical protein